MTHYPTALRTMVNRVVKMQRLTIRQILAWADNHYQHTGQWPKRESGRVYGVPGEEWQRIDKALCRGYRGLPPGSSLAQLLAKHRGVRNQKALSQLTIRQILRWADTHHQRTGRWPTSRSGKILGAEHETWHAVVAAMDAGCRGLPRKYSLHKLLLKYRGPQVQSVRRSLTIRQILAWADAHYERTGKWPRINSGPVQGALGETWKAINSSLRFGHRTLPGGLSLRQVLVESQGASRRVNVEPMLARADAHPQRVVVKPRLTIRQILAWADAYYRHAGRWPTRNSGSVEGAPVGIPCLIAAAEDFPITNR